MVLNAALELTDTGPSRNIAFSSAVLQAVLLTANNTELIHLHCIFLEAQLPTELVRRMLKDP